MPRKSPNPTSVPSLEGGTLISLEQNLLPKSIITRLAKSAIPEGSMVQKDAQLALAKSSTVFVNRLIDEANEKARLAGKKTIMPKDVFDALHEMDLAEFIPTLTTSLDAFSARAAAKRAASGASKPTTTTTTTAAAPGADTNDDDEERPSKKLRPSTPTTAAAEAVEEDIEEEVDVDVDVEEEEEVEAEEEEEEEPHIINDTREVVDVEGEMEELEGAEERDEALDNGDDSD